MPENIQALSKKAPHPKALLFILLGLHLGVSLPTFYGMASSTLFPTILTEWNAMQFYAIAMISSSLAMSVTTPIAGKLGDLFGRKKVFQFGTLVYLGAISGCAAAPNIVVFCGFFMFAGCGQGIVSSMSNAIIADIVPKQDVPKHVGYASTISMVVQFIAPVTAGVIADSFGWRVFLAAFLPLSALSFFLLMKFLDGSTSPLSAKPVIDFVGIVALLGTLAPFLFLLSAGGSIIPWQSPGAYILLAIMLLSAVVLTRTELRHPSPIIDISLFRDAAFLRLFVLSLLMCIASSTVVSYLPLYIQNILGYSASMSGTLVTPRAVVTAIVTAFFGGYVAKTGRYKGSLLFMMVFAVASYALMWRGFHADTGTFFFLLVTILNGVGSTAMITLVISFVMLLVPREKLGSGISLIVFTASFGGSLGNAIGGFITNAMWKSVPIPADLAAALSPAQLGALSQSGILRNPQEIAAIRATLAAPLADTFDLTIAALRTALGGSISAMFLLFLVVTILAFAITLTIRVPKKEA